MGVSQTKDIISLPANADLSAAADQYKFVKLVNASGVAACAVSGLGEEAIGTIYEGGNAAGAVSAIGRAQVIKFRAGANLTAGARIQSNATGQGIAVTGGGFALGILLKSVSTGEVGTMLWQPQGTA